MKRSRVRASLTIGATCAAAAVSISDSSSRKVRASTVCRTRTPCRHATVNQRNPEKGLIGVFAAFTEVLKARVILHLADVYRTHLLGHQTGKALVHSHAQRADRLRLQSDRRGQHQVGAIRFQQVHRADIGVKAAGDQGDDVPQRLRRLAALGGELANLLQRQNVIRFCPFNDLGHMSGTLLQIHPALRSHGIRVSGRAAIFLSPDPNEAL